MTAVVGQITVVWSWADETGSTAKPRMNLPQAGISAAAADAIAMAPVAAALSGCALMGFSLNYRVVESGSQTTGGQSVKVVGVLVFDCAGDDERAFFELPGLKANLISSDPPYVDVPPDAPAIAALAASIISQGFCNPSGYAATTFVAVLWRQDT